MMVQHKAKIHIQRDRPRKRPRATLTPSMVTRNGEPYMAFGTPGGDSQEQWTIQFFMNHVETTGAEPLEEAEPTEDQISAMCEKVVTRDEAPYADFLVLTPFEFAPGTRLHGAEEVTIPLLVR